MTVFTMFFIELMASRFELFGPQGQLESSDPTKSMLNGREKYTDSALPSEYGMFDVHKSHVALGFLRLLNLLATPLLSRMLYHD